MSLNGYPMDYATQARLAYKQYHPSWNAPELPDYLALAKEIAERSSCAPSEISPRSFFELPLSVGRNSPHISKPTNSLMNERNGNSYLYRNNPVSNINRPTPLTTQKTLVDKKEVPICFDFVQGKCRRQNCRYQHDFGAVIRHNSRESRICFDHLRGECTRGSLCRFSHDLRPLILQSLEDAARQVTEPKANGICYDFCRGACPRRGTCPWTHNLIEIAWSTAKQPLSDHQKLTILKKVLDVVLSICPHQMSEAEIVQLLQQSVNPMTKNSSSPYPYPGGYDGVTRFISPLGSASSGSYNFPEEGNIKILKAEDQARLLSSTSEPATSTTMRTNLRDTNMTTMGFNF